MLTRRLQWPLVTLSLLACLALLAVVISGKRRAWWLLALAPVMALFMHRFSLQHANALHVLENPPFVDASTATFLLDDDWIVGVSYAGERFALPYAALYGAPVLVHAEHDKRLMVMWSPYANCATAYSVSRELRARDLEIPGMPHNGLLLYDRRLGQFISGITGHMPGGQKPVGLISPVATKKMTWRQWREMYPESRVLAVGSAAMSAPASPLMPKYKMPDYDDVSAETCIALILAEQPLAVRCDDVAADPLNLTIGPLAVLLVRDANTGIIRAFDRRIEPDLIPRFRLNSNRRRANVVFVDSDTDIGWSAAGVAIDGNKEMRGHQLKSIAVEDGLYWGVMKYWFPALELAPPP